MKDLKKELEVKTLKPQEYACSFFLFFSFQGFDREKDLSLLHVYFKDLTMIKYNKDIIYSIEV